MVTQQRTLSLELLEDWDPLHQSDIDPTLLLAAQRREIRNILKSYTGYYDLFAELLQNALDAVDRRMKEAGLEYKPRIWLKIDMANLSVSITDNGCGMSYDQFKQFMKPNYSFKDGKNTRGNKGVGATYLAYGFNHLEIATKQGDKTFSGILKNGREWVEDKSDTFGRPKVTLVEVSHSVFNTVDRGTSMTLKLGGDHTRPKNFSYNGATNAKQWLSILRTVTPLGGLYFCSETAPNIDFSLEVIDPVTSATTTESLSKLIYTYPHEVLGATADIRDFLADQLERSRKGADLSKIPPKFLKLAGLWGEWTGEQIVNDESPIKPKLDDEERELISQLGIKIYMFLCFSTELWNEYNDTKLGLRKGMRILRGGLQLATRNMPQGLPITIPLTNNIGVQNIAHVIVHFDNAEPDLGRKGFQPEHVRIAERLAVSAVTAFTKYFHLLRGKTGAPALVQQMKLSAWIDEQKKHEQDHPLLIKGKGLFLPTEELPIRSIPVVEQDVVSLFNQMLSSGIIRGIQILSSSQYKQYDGLYRVVFELPYERYIHSDENPLGVSADQFTGSNGNITGPVSIYEYKLNLDALMEEFDCGQKSPDEVSLVVAWEIGSTWSTSFEVTSFLDNEHTHHRPVHGFTHSFAHCASHTHAFHGIILKDLVQFLNDPILESSRQHKHFGVDSDV